MHPNPTSHWLPRAQLLRSVGNLDELGSDDKRRPPNTMAGRSGTASAITS